MLWPMRRWIFLDSSFLYHQVSLLIFFQRFITLRWPIFDYYIEEDHIHLFWQRRLTATRTQLWDYILLPAICRILSFPHKFGITINR